MDWIDGLIRKKMLFFVIATSVFTYVHGQDMTNVLVKVYDDELNPCPSIGIVLDNMAKFKTDEKGKAFVMVPTASLPPKAIDVSDKKLDAESWNYGNGMLEIIVRKKNYRELIIKIADKNHNALKGIKVRLSTNKPSTLTSNDMGNISFVLPITTNINNPLLFQIDGYNIIEQNLSDEGGVILIEQIEKPSVQASAKVNKDKPDVNIIEHSNKNDKKDSIEYLYEVNLEKLDSITSVTVLYSLMKKMNYEDLDSLPKKMLNDKFVQIMLDNQPSSKTLKSLLSLVSDTSFVNRDIELIIEKIQFEKEVLIQSGNEFEEAANRIELKLEHGGENLSIDERDQLIQLVTDLESMLKENEDLFFKNNNVFKKQVESLQRQITNVFELEDQLFKSELFSKNFKQIFILSSISFAGLAIIIFFLKYLIRTLREQKSKLAEAKEEIENINANLENLVDEKTLSLKLINSELDTFQYRSSHNLKRPITSIKGLASIAKMTLTGEAAGLFDKVAKTATEMDNMLDKLTTMNYINKPTDFSEIDFEHIIEGHKSKFAKQIEESNIAFSISIQKNIKFNSYPLIVDALIYNLIENAVFFSCFSQESVSKVELSLALDDVGINLSVKDNGCGIEQGIQSNIWNMFYIGNEKSTGEGLGLYIVKKAIESLKGSIDLNTRVNEFCEFNVVLPILEQSRKRIEKYESIKMDNAPVLS